MRESRLELGFYVLTRIFLCSSRSSSAPTSPPPPRLLCDPSPAS